MSWEVKFQVKKKEWLSNPVARWNRGLERAGFNFRQGLQRDRYPPIKPDSSSVRTYLTADKANFEITEYGHVMTFGSTFYLPFILYGTSKWEGWPGKYEELIELMQDGFRSAIVEEME